MDLLEYLNAHLIIRQAFPDSETDRQALKASIHRLNRPVSETIAPDGAEGSSHNGN